MFSAIHWETSKVVDLNMVESFILTKVHLNAGTSNLI